MFRRLGAVVGAVVCVVALVGCVPHTEPLAKSVDVLWDPVSVDSYGDRDGIAEFDMLLDTLVGEYSPVWDCAVMGNQ